MPPLFHLFNINSQLDWKTFFLPTLGIMISSYETGEIIFIKPGTISKLDLTDNTVNYDDGECEVCIAFVSIYVIDNDNKVWVEKTEAIKELYKSLHEVKHCV